MFSGLKRPTASISKSHHYNILDSKGSKAGAFKQKNNGKTQYQSPQMRRPPAEEDRNKEWAAFRCLAAIAGRFSELIGAASRKTSDCIEDYILVNIFNKLIFLILGSLDEKFLNFFVKFSRINNFILSHWLFPSNFLLSLF